mmetsp:Transcript_22663/g.39108  ORF Transcript_22663/g.39108 Transcript_22663/m.39108 type:complete len:280 (+) Transcript_22663:67-906(+)
MATIQGPINTYAALFEDDTNHKGSDIISVVQRIFASHSNVSNVSEWEDIVQPVNDMGKKRRHEHAMDEDRVFKYRRLETRVSPVSTMPNSHQTSVATRSPWDENQCSELLAQILSDDNEPGQKDRGLLQCGQQESASRCSHTEHGSATEEEEGEEEEKHETLRDADETALYRSYLESVLNSPFCTTLGERCSFCPDRIFFRRHDLIRHIKTWHIRDRPFHCAVEGCSGKFKRKSHLDSHIKAVHERCLSFTCQYCNRVYSSDSTRRKHIRVNHDTTVYD